MRFIISLMFAFVACATTKPTKPIAAPPTVKVAAMPKVVYAEVNADAPNWHTMYLVDRQGATVCICADAQIQGRMVCRECNSLTINPTTVARLKGEYEYGQCLAVVGSTGMQRYPHDRPPGQVVSHQRAPDGQLYHRYYKEFGQQHFICPLRPRTECDQSRNERGDEACVIYDECSEVCPNPQGEIW